MSDDSHMGFFVTITMVLMILGCFVAGYSVGKSNSEESQRREVQIQAVKAGYARWVVTDDGKIVFQWIPRVEK